jgi:hypothetical protein
MHLVIDTQGMGHCLYNEAIDLSALGDLIIRRASQVEADEWGRWWADMKPLHGPRLGPFDRRSEALAQEQAWLENNWLNAS